MWAIHCGAMRKMINSSPTGYYNRLVKLHEHDKSKVNYEIDKDLKRTFPGESFICSTFFSLVDQTCYGLIINSYMDH